MKVAVIGSRCADVEPNRILQELPEECTCIISGGARGVDAAASRCAREYGFRLEEISPDYDTYGRQAPLVRNKEIVRRADYVLAFWDYRSSGTRNTILECLKQRKRFKIILVTKSV